MYFFHTFPLTRGKYFLPPFGKGKWGGILRSNFYAKERKWKRERFLIG
jgi:hypothetical protein